MYVIGQEMQLSCYIVAGIYRFVCICLEYHVVPLTQRSVSQELNHCIVQVPVTCMCHRFPPRVLGI